MEQKVDALMAMLETMAGRTSLPRVLTMKRAAYELSVSRSKLKTMVRRGQIRTCEVGSRPGIPLSEILRIEQVRLVEKSLQTSLRPRRAAPYDARAEAQAIRDAIKREAAENRRRAAAERKKRKN